MEQQELFAEPVSGLPPGLRYQPALVAPDEADQITPLIAALPFKEFEFHGFTGRRRVVSFGWRYDFSARRIEQVDDIPPFLLPLRDRAAVFASLAADALQHALVTEYQAGAAIGWHKDKAVFDEVVGLSFGSSCTMRFRRKAGDGWERRSLTLDPGSAYLIAGAARTEWEHSIPPVRRLRYSVTFRSMRQSSARSGGASRERP